MSAPRYAPVIMDSRLFEEDQFRVAEDERRREQYERFGPALMPASHFPDEPEPEPDPMEDFPPEPEGESLAEPSRPLLMKMYRYLHLDAKETPHVCGWQGEKYVEKQNCKRCVGEDLAWEILTRWQHGWQD